MRKVRDLYDWDKKSKSRINEMRRTRESEEEGELNALRSVRKMSKNNEKYLAKNSFNSPKRSLRDD